MILNISILIPVCNFIWFYQFVHLYTCWWVKNLDDDSLSGAAEFIPDVSPFLAQNINFLVCREFIEILDTRLRQSYFVFSSKLYLQEMVSPWGSLVSCFNNNRYFLVQICWRRLLHMERQLSKCKQLINSLFNNIFTHKIEINGTPNFPNKIITSLSVFIENPIQLI